MVNHVLLFSTPLIQSVKWKDWESKMDKEKYLLYNAQLISLPLSFSDTKELSRMSLLDYQVYSLYPCKHRIIQDLKKNSQASELS